MFEWNNINQWLDTGTLVFVRTSVMIATAPVVSAPYVPARVQIILALLITLVVLPLIPAPVNTTVFSLTGSLIAIEQILIGLAMGFILKVVFEIFSLAGQFMAMQSGLGYAMVVDPSRGTQVAVIGQLFVITATVVFVITNGHLVLIQMLVNSFEQLPLTTTALQADHYMRVVYFAREIFIGGVNIALPAVTALLLLNFSMAMMNRAAPQLHLFTIGFPLMLLVGLMAIYFTYGITFEHTEDEFQTGFHFMQRWLGN